MIFGPLLRVVLACEHFLQNSKVQRVTRAAVRSTFEFPSRVNLSCPSL